MIPYIGGPVTPDVCAIAAWQAGHAFISYAHHGQLRLASEICQSFGLDNGAFTDWKKGKITDWVGYYEFIARWMNHPRFDFCIIPDVIDGGEKANDELIEQWPHGSIGVPVWHMNESDERFIRLCNEHDRVAIGSCGEYDVRRPRKAVEKLKDVIRHVVDANGYPIAKLHGLRMLNPQITKHIPLASADSTSLAQNIGIDKNWKGTYQPHSKVTRAKILRERIESHNSASALFYDEETDKVSIQMAFDL